MTGIISELVAVAVAVSIIDDALFVPPVSTPGQVAEPLQAFVLGSSFPSNGQSQYPSLIQALGIATCGESAPVHPLEHVTIVVLVVASLLLSSTRDAGPVPAAALACVGVVQNPTKSTTNDNDSDNDGSR